MYMDLQTLRQARNRTAHRPGEASDADMRKAFDIAKELIVGLQKAKDAGYTFNPMIGNADSE